MSDMTFGLELEVGDVPRDLGIPAELGAWEHAERDVVNTLSPYRGVAADPLGIEPPVGGEVNVRPAREVGQLVLRTQEILGLMPTATTSPMAHTHVHVRVPGLRDDGRALYRLMRYVADQQDDAVRLIHAFRWDPRMSPKVRNYLKWDGARRLSKWRADVFRKSDRSFDAFIHAHACGRDGTGRGRPIRTAINTYCLKHIDTVEFRLFRGTVQPGQIESCIQFARDFMEAALGDQRPVRDLVAQNQYHFPAMWYDHELCVGWERTQHPATRGQKVRKFYAV